MDDPLVIAGEAFSSRLIMGTGGAPSLDVLGRALAASGRVLEVNTKSGLASVDLVRWWREEGGRAVSFGSDAHLPNRVGDRFKLAADIVEQAGFRPGHDPYDFWRA